MLYRPGLSHTSRPSAGTRWPTIHWIGTTTSDGTHPATIRN